MASVNSLVLINENVAADGSSAKKSVEIGHTDFLAHLEITNEALTTIDVDVEHSPDGINWYVLGSFPQASANGTALIQLSTPSVHVLPNVRATMDVTGGNADVKVTLWYDRRK